MLSTPLLCLAGVTAWTLLLTFAVVIWRVIMVLRGEYKANQFPHGVQHGSDRYWRLNRAHINALENLPLIAVLILLAALSGIDSPRISLLAEVYLAARIIQSILHISSNRVAVVKLRFTSFVIQLLCLTWMLFEIVKVVS